MAGLMSSTNGSIPIDNAQIEYNQIAVRDI